MSSPVAPPFDPAKASDASYITEMKAAAVSAAVVLAFWWIATGGIVALERTTLNRTVGPAVSLALAGLGAWLLVRYRSDPSVRAVRGSAMGGALVWTGAALSFYTGWIVGSGTPATGSGPSLDLAFQAMRALHWSELTALGAVVVTAWLTRGSPNRAGLAIVLVFWFAHQVARLNVFLGVANPASHFLPPDLAFLETYFGPARNSPAFPVSIVGMVLLVAGTVRWARTAADPARRHGAAIVATLLALALLELLLLGIDSNLPIWEPFLRIRGG